MSEITSVSAAQRIIRDGVVVEDHWRLVEFCGHGIGEILPISPRLIVPLKVWLAECDALTGNQRALGVWLDSHEDPAELADDIEHLQLIAVNFPTFKDGRGYSIAYLLRSRYGYTGELRAIGDVLRDQLFYLQRVGFNSFAVRADKDIDDAIKSLRDFSDSYQGSTDQPEPLFRRRTAGARSAKADA
jgi:uncharacterized protein (DUF934 family)